MSYQHFPVIAVMTMFLAAFLTEIFAHKNTVIRNIISVVATAVPLVLMILLFKPVFIDKEIITYWMGNWEPVNGYAIGIGYEIDALSLLFATMASLAFFLANLYGIGYMKGDKYFTFYNTLFFMLEGAILGLMMTGDIFNMFVMIEILTFSAVALTGFDRHKDGSLEAALKYLVVCSVGSSCTLTGIALIYRECHTLNMAQLASFLCNRLNPVTLLALGLIVVGFSVKSFMFPFHTPLADAHSVAPSPISMILSGVVTKCGIYGMIRMVYTVFRAMDHSELQTLLCIIGIITMFVGATMAIVQDDFKRLLSFSSISQLGYIITAASLGTLLGLNGALYHAVNHTLFKGLLFLCAGAVLHMTGGKTKLTDLGGISKKMPQTTFCFLIGAAAISGLPPLNGFASKWMIYQACYTKAIESHNPIFIVATVVALIVSVMTLAYFVKITHAVFFGQLKPENENVKEAPAIMLIPMYILSALCIFAGVGYKLVDVYFIHPGAVAAFNVTKYIDSMMGAGYSAFMGVSNMAAKPVSFSFYSPVVWLVLFVVILLATLLVILLSQGDRGKILEGKRNEDAKYDVFFSGEKAEYSQASGPDLFWGFRYNFRKYYDIFIKMHSGILTDYTSMAVIAAGIIVLFIFVFVR